MCFDDGNELEALGEGFGFEAQQFPFGPLLLKFLRAPVDPSLTLGQHPVNQQRQIVGHGFDGCREGGQVFAQMPVSASELALAVEQRAGRHP